MLSQNIAKHEHDQKVQKIVDVKFDAISKAQEITLKNLEKMAEENLQAIDLELIHKHSSFCNSLIKDLDNLPQSDYDIDAQKERAGNEVLEAGKLESKISEEFSSEMSDEPKRRNYDSITT